MQASRNGWMILAAALLVTTVACVSGSIDDGEGADVVLQVTQIQTDPVTGETEVGTCSISGNECLSNDNCPEGEFCDLPINPGDCTISEWSATLQNKPLNPLANTSPFNDISLQLLTIAYDWQDGVTVTPDATVAIGLTIPADSQGTVQFFPISFDDLASDNTTVNLTLTFDGVTGAGDAVSVTTGGQLVIEDCLP